MHSCIFIPLLVIRINMLLHFLIYPVISVSTEIFNFFLLLVGNSKILEKFLPYVELFI